LAALSRFLVFYCKTGRVCLPNFFFFFSGVPAAGFIPGLSNCASSLPRCRSTPRMWLVCCLFMNTLVPGSAACCWANLDFFLPASEIFPLACCLPAFQLCSLFEKRILHLAATLCEASTALAAYCDEPGPSGQSHLLIYLLNKWFLIIFPQFY